MISEQQTQGVPVAPSYSVSVDDVTEAEWSRTVSLFDDASLYQTWAYGAVSWGTKQLSHLVLRRGEQVVASTQVRIVRMPLVPAGVAYIRSGPLWRRRGEPIDTEILAAMVRAIVSVYSERRGLLLRVIPNCFGENALAHEISETWQRHGFSAVCSAAPYRTIRVDLASPSEEMRKRLDQKWRNQLNVAERNALRVTSGTSEELFARFLRIYDEMMVRKRFETTVDPREFAVMQNRLPPDHKMVVMTAEKDGELVAGVIGTSVGETGIYLLGATSDTGMKSKGSYLLQWSMMKHMREAGCRWYDLGGINPETNPGVYHFKQGMGGEECRQLGRFAREGSALSTVAVRAGERIQAFCRSARAAFRWRVRK